MTMGIFGDLREEAARRRSDAVADALRRRSDAFLDASQRLATEFERIDEAHAAAVAAVMSDADVLAWEGVSPGEGFEDAVREHAERLLLAG